MPAIVIAAAITAAAGAGSAVYASNKAAGATKAATNAAIAEQNNALNAQLAITSPYRNLGQAAIPQLQALLGIGSGKGNTASTLKALESTPGYQFTQQQGDQATLNAATATGMLGSGNTLEALDKFNTGLADQTYQQAVQNAQNAVNTGEGAATGTAAMVGNTAANIGGQIVGAGNNLASLDTNLAATLSGQAGNVANAYILNNTLANLNPNNAGSGLDYQFPTSQPWSTVQPIAGNTGPAGPATTYPLT